MDKEGKDMAKNIIIKLMMIKLISKENIKKGKEMEKGKNILMIIKLNYSKMILMKTRLNLKGII